MKKWIFAIFLLLTLSACGGSDSSGTPSNNNNASTMTWDQDHWDSKNWE